MISLQKINSKVLSRQRGVSMVELMVAMGLGLFLLFALIEILINGKQSFGSANHLSRLQENGRIVTNLLVSDLKRAGYMGGNSDIPRILGTTNQLLPATGGCPGANTDWARMISQPIFGLDDTKDGYDCIPVSDYLRGDVLVVRHVAPWLAPATLVNTRLYLRSSLFEGKIFLGSKQGDAANLVDDTPNSVRELQAHAYFIGPSENTCGGSPVPSLYRVSLNDNSVPVSQELLPGVEQFQVQYGVNDQYLDADKVTLTDWPNVVTARIWILVRSECSESGFSDETTYNMGDQAYKPAEKNFRRQLYSSVVMIRN